MNYRELKEALANYLVSSELIVFIPTAIKMAEAKFNRTLRTREMLRRAFTTSDEQYTKLPEDYAMLRSVYLTGQPTRRLEFASMSKIRLDVSQDGDKDKPQLYTIVGDSIELYPSPDAEYELEIVYYQRIPTLTDARPTNWLLERHPDLYIHGALLQAAPYMGNDPRIATWDTQYKTAISEIEVDTDRAEFTGGPLKVRAKPL